MLLQEIKEHEKTDKWKYYRAETYRLQSQVRYWMKEVGEMLGYDFSSEYHRTAKCLVTRYKTEVEVVKTERGATYKGLVSCGCVWTCPVCAGKIQRQRREEIKKLVEWAYKTGNKCIMVTLTFPHYQNQHAYDLMQKFSNAMRFLRSGKQWQNIKRQIGFKGMVRGLEVLKSIDHGWHIHTHELWIMSKYSKMQILTGDGPMKTNDVEIYLYPLLVDRWEKAVEREGLILPGKETAFRKHSVDIQDNAHSSDYLQKSSWGCDAEIAATAQKKCKHGLTPFQLIDQGRKEEFLEYANAMHGRSQLFWSSRLKERAGIEDKSDSEVAEEIGEHDVLGAITADEWWLIVSLRARVKILEIAEDEGYQGVKRWIDARI